MGGPLGPLISSWRIRVMVAVAAVSLALVLVVLGSVAGAADMGPMEGEFPVDPAAQNGVVHLRIVTDQIDTKRSLSRDLWLETSTGDFLAVERENSEVVSVAACDGTSVKKYDVSSHRAGNFTLAKLMFVEPDVVTSQRGSLEALRGWVADMVRQSGEAGESAIVHGRAALAYADIGQGQSTPRATEVSQLDLVVDESTGLPLQAVVHRPNGDVLSRTEYDYEVAGAPEGGFTVVFPEGYYVQTDQDLAPPGEDNLTVGELVRTVKHPVYWAGDSFEARSLTGCKVAKSGVVNLKYGEDGDYPSKSGASPLISVYEYVPSELDPEVLSSIEGQLTNPRRVEGKRGTYTVYDAALNGMPMLEVVIGDVHVVIADVEEGDVGVMVRAADALFEAVD